MLSGRKAERRDIGHVDSSKGGQLLHFRDQEQISYFTGIMILLLLSALIASTAAQPWWTGGQCGESKYPDAGEACSGSLSGPCTRVIGGTTARENEFPWVAYTTRTTTGEFLCAGTIINENFIVTSARCTNPLGPGDIDVVIGASNRTGTPAASEQVFSVSGVFEHEEYDQGVRINDISLIKLSESINFTDEVKPICPPNPAEGNYNARRVEFAGWGATINDGSPSNNLMYTSMAVVQASYCVNQWVLWFSIQEEHVCASDTGTHSDRDKCRGDGGGAIAHKNPDGFYEIVGVTCFGRNNCADEGYPGVYTRISSHVDWINNKIEKNP